MVATPEPRQDRRFACTLCGACCDRSPEVLLSEAAGLSDMFVFRLMFRLYEVPRGATDRHSLGQSASGSNEAFYQAKRLLAAFSAHRSFKRRRVGQRSVELAQYLIISALTVDTDIAGCSALNGRRCSIHERRPLACRTVPFHYSHPEASAAARLDAFVQTPGYRCDTTAAAPIVVEGSRIADPASLQARREAITIADEERPWQEAIVRNLKSRSRRHPLPSLSQIEAAADFGALTTSMRLAWEIGVEAGIMSTNEYRRLMAEQAVVIDRMLGAGRYATQAGETLREMRVEYRQLLDTL